MQVVVVPRQAVVLQVRQREAARAVARRPGRARGRWRADFEGGNDTGVREGDGEVSERVEMEAEDDEDWREGDGEVERVEKEVDNDEGEGEGEAERVEKDAWRVGDGDAERVEKTVGNDQGGREGDGEAAGLRRASCGAPRSSDVDARRALGSLRHGKRGSLARYCFSVVVPACTLRCAGFFEEQLFQVASHCCCCCCCCC